MSPEQLIAFEEDIAAEFNAGKIRAPVHLSSGNEQQLCDIFRGVWPLDWVCSTWRSHYHCLLKGVPAEEVKAEIMAGRSINLCFPNYRVVTSAIVGGIIPIALGISIGLRQANENRHVWCFIGDMTARTGIFHEAHAYAVNFDLPITFVIEDNGVSVCTNTREAWNDNNPIPLTRKVRYYRYQNKRWPHAGAGQRVQF